MSRSLTFDTEYDSDLNSVIMDYLISEGYPSAAQKFALEANIQPQVDVESIRERVEIRNAIYGGDIQSAIEKINELNPQVSFGGLLRQADCVWRQKEIPRFAMIRHFMHHSYTLRGAGEKQNLLQSSK